MIRRVSIPYRGNKDKLFFTVVGASTVYWASEFSIDSPLYGCVNLDSQKLFALGVPQYGVDKINYIGAKYSWRRTLSMA